jgi:hypothetical protein
MLPCTRNAGRAGPCSFRMGHFHYARHFGVLAAATVIMFLLAHWSLFTDSLIVTFALNGALHALALVAALRAPQPLVRKIAFIAIAAALSVVTLYVGIIGLASFAALPGNQRLYVVLGVCSLSGGITYGSLIRMFWMRIFSSRVVLVMAVFCLVATSIAFFARSYSDFFGGWWLAAAWWFALSGSLWYFDTHREALKLQVKSPSKEATP